MVCKKCKDAFKWLDKLNKHYQPIYSFEKEYINKGKIDESRVVGFNKILTNILSVSGVPKGKRFLDIGCNLGWFCFMLDEQGGDCIGIELDKRRIEVCNAVKDKMGLKDHPSFWDGDAREWLKNNSDVEFNYIILLNAIHHMFVQDEDGTWEMFNDLLERSRGIFIMVRTSLKGWSLKYPRDVPKSFLEQSDATNCIVLDRVHGRTIYFFSKDQEKSEEILSVSTKI